MLPLKPAPCRLATMLVPRPARCEAPTTAIVCGLSSDAIACIRIPRCAKKSLPRTGHCLYVQGADAHTEVAVGLHGWTARGVGAALAFAATTGLGFAQDFPTRPITLSVPFTAGGPADTAARTISESLRRQLGQTMVIENKPGA